MGKSVVVLASGETQRRALPHLVQSLRAEGIDVPEVRIPSRNRDLTTEVAAQLARATWFDLNGRGHPPDKIVVLVDADGRTPEEAVAALDGLEGRLRKPSGPGNAPGPGPTSRPGTFDFLGLTHHWGVSRNGNWVVKRKTAATRLRRALRTVHAWCRRHRHEPVPVQYRMLCAVMRGHYQYYGLTGNAYALNLFHNQVIRTWRTWLNRRSQNARMHWNRFTRLLTRYPLPPAYVVHSIYRTAASLSRSGAECGRSARPDLWGAGEGNLLGLPDTGCGTLRITLRWQ